MEEAGFKMRTPRIGDRVAIPGHAVVFIVKSVDETSETVNLDKIVEPRRVEQGILWKMLTFIEN
jgi:hypothetical protein